MFVRKILHAFQRIQWKLTFSYSAVTVGSLSVVVLILGYLAFSRTFIPIEIFNNQITPGDWIQLITKDTPLWRKVLKQDPIDTNLIAALLQYSNLTITSFDILQVGDFHVQMTTAAQGAALIVDPRGILLGTTNTTFVSQDAVGKPLDMGLLPGLEEPVKAALAGEVDPEQLFVTIEPNERFYFAAPIFDDTSHKVLGIGIVYFIRMPTSDDIPSTILALLGRSVLVLLIAAGVVGTLFGALTARGMVSRLKRVSKVTDAWSQGDFSEYIQDSVKEQTVLLGREKRPTGKKSSE